MGLDDVIKKFFGASTATPADEPRLSGASETTLGRELQGLSSGARAWITMAERRQSSARRTSHGQLRPAVESKPN
jgi:hypothetical protein